MAVEEEVAVAVDAEAVLEAEAVASVEVSIFSLDHWMTTNWSIHLLFYF